MRGTRFLAVALMAGVSLLPAQEDRIRLMGHDWEKVVEPAAFGERYIHRGTLFNDRMFISGGFNDKDMFLGDVWSSADGKDWRPDVQTAPWSARFAHGMVALDDAMYLMGGYDGELLSDVWKSVDGADWELVTDSAPWSPRSDFQVLAHDGAIFLLGGKGRAKRHADVWKTTDGAEWELLTESAWPARSHFGAVSHNGEIVILGGAFFDFEDNHHYYHRDTWSSADGRDWTLLNKNLPQSRRCLVELVSVGPYIYAIGGDDRHQYTSMRRDAWVSPDGVDWMKLRRQGNLAQRRRLEYDLRANHVLLAKDDAIYIIGGHETWSGSFVSTHRFGHWTTANVWKSTGEHHPNFVPEYGWSEHEVSMHEGDGD